MFEKESLSILEQALAHLEEGFEDLPPIDQPVDLQRMEPILLDSRPTHAG